MKKQVKMIKGKLIIMIYLGGWRRLKLMTRRSSRNKRRPLWSRNKGRPLRGGQRRPIRVGWLAGGPCKSVGVVLVWSSMSRSGGVVEGDGVALRAGHRLLVVAAGGSCLATLQRLSIDCGLLLTGLMREFGE